MKALRKEMKESQRADYGNTGLYSMEGVVEMIKSSAYFAETQHKSDIYASTVNVGGRGSPFSLPTHRILWPGQWPDTSAFDAVVAPLGSGAVV